MTSSGLDTFDLLGLDAPAQVVKPVTSAPTSTLLDVDPVAGTSTTGAMVNMGEDQASHPSSLEIESGKRYVVRCEGRWRVRSAPSLNSKVIGTIANGTIVFGEDCSGEVHPETSVQDMEGLMQQDESIEPEVLQKALGSLTALWVKVTKLEAQEPMGVSDIKRDTATGGGIYCLRRNAVGYGLYQENAEPLTGPLIHLPPGLGLELRLDAQRAASERTEDVSLTWKLLGAAESLGRLFGSDESGFSEDIKTPSRRRPEDLFELKQRDQLKKALSSLRAPLVELVEKAKEGHHESQALLTTLPRDLSRQFARLRSSVLAAHAEANSLVVRPMQETEEKSGGPLMGSIEELSNFNAACEALERTGAWACLDAKIRQEVIAFSASHAQEIQKHLRIRCKELGHEATPQTPQDTGVLDDLLDTAAPSRGGYTSTMAVPPLLPPPPVSSCSVTRST
ncbi:unnamed protein product [Durusdinium trenchii]|uniref:Uncharacterized protein n=2 Tax=Durusdinium trenchii TaxID=1381693 RepID=A0ABP0IWR2_9DINO